MITPPIHYCAEKFTLLDSAGNTLAYGVQPAIAEQLATAINQQAMLWTTLSHIADLCVAEIAMGMDLDTQHVCDLLYSATGMTEQELATHCKQLKHTAAGG